MPPATSTHRRTPPYLTKQRICFLLACFILALICGAILIYRSKVVHVYDLIRLRLANSSDLNTSESINHKEQFIALLDNFIWIHLMFSLTGPLDMTPDYYLVKHLLVASIFLSLTLQFLMLIVATSIDWLPLTPDLLYWTSIDIMFIEIVLFIIFTFNILVSARLYYPLMKQLASRHMRTDGSNASERQHLTDKVGIDSEANQKPNDNGAKQGRETTITLD